jgi:hypothetical protein
MLPNFRRIVYRRVYPRTLEVLQLPKFALTTISNRVYLVTWGFHASFSGYIHKIDSPPLSSRKSSFNTKFVPEA